MEFSFNLIDQPWIPCTRADGARVELSLRDTLMQAHHLREIQGDTPLETAALHRLSLAVLHRVYGPATRQGWTELWKRKTTGFGAEVREYLRRRDIYERFDLFHPERPFYQSRVSRAARKSVTSLVFNMASGNNATLFDHHTEQTGATLTPAQAARALITSQAFGVGGLSGVPEKFTDAPCAKGIVFLASGETLYETLALNCIQYRGDEPVPSPGQDDRPAWEMDDPFLPDRRAPKGYLDYLTWHNRRIRLYPEQTATGIVVREMSWLPGLRLSDQITDPMKAYLADKKTGLSPLCFETDRALWRDSAVLFRLSGGHRPPQVVKWMADLAYVPPRPLEESRQYRLTALGLAKSRASLDFLRAEKLPLSLKLLSDENCIGTLNTALELAEKTGGVLRRCAFLLAWLIHSPAASEREYGRPEEEPNQRDRIDNKIRQGANSKSNDREAQQVWQLFSSFGVERLYWSSLEAHFYRFLQDLPDKPDAARSAWYDRLRKVAQAAFDQAKDYAGVDLRAQRAIATADEQFRRGLGRLFSGAQSATPGGETHATE